MGRLKIETADAELKAVERLRYPLLRAHGAATYLKDPMEVKVGQGSLTSVVNQTGSALGMGPFSFSQFPTQDLSLARGSHTPRIGSLMFAQPLTQLWRIDSGVRAAKAGATEAQRESARIDAKLRLGVEELFVGLLVQSLRTAEKQAALTWQERRLRDAENAQQNGEVLDDTVLALKAAVVDARTKFTRSQQDYARLSLELADLIGRSGSDDLTRDRSHVALTDAGKAFYASISKLLLQVDIAVTEAQQIARGATGELVICTDWRVDAHFVSTAIEEFRRQHARVEIAVRDAGFKEQIDMLRSGEAHVGFIAREYIRKQGELQFFPIQRVFINAIVSLAHPFARRKQVRLADLAKEKWVDLTEKEAAGFRGYLVQQCRISGFVPRFAKTASTLDGLYGHVASGYGITASPDHVRPGAGLPLGLVRTDCPPVEFGAVWRNDNRSPLLVQFIEVLRGKIAAAAEGRSDASRPHSVPA